MISQVIVLFFYYFCVLLCYDYFRTAIINAINQPTTVHPNNQLDIRTYAVAVLFFFVCRASQAGAKMIVNTTIVARTYLKHKKIIPPQFISLVFGGVLRPLYNALSYYKPYFAFLSSSSSIRTSWLYFAIRSVRDIEPVLICPAFVATAKSAMVVSSVSPLRCEITTP